MCVCFFIFLFFVQGEDSAFDAVRNIYNEVKSISKESKEELDARRREIEENLRGVELNIERYLMVQKRAEVDVMSRRLGKRQEFLTQLEEKSKRSGAGGGDNDYSDEYDDDDSDDDDRSHSPGRNDSKLDMLVVKLEKLDKLDELLKKLDNMKVFFSLYDQKKTSNDLLITTLNTIDYTGKKNQL